MPVIATRFKGRFGNNMWQWAALRSFLADHKDYKLGIDFCCRTPNSIEFFARQGIQHMSNIAVMNHVSFIERDEREFTPIPDNVEEGCLDGYFQNPAYFKGHEDLIRNEYKDLVSSIKFDGVLGIHVRLTDYLTTDHIYYTLTPATIKEAIQQIPAEHRKTVVLFSDDPKMASNILMQAGITEFEVDQSRSSAMVLQNMTACDSFIMSNSSLAWWACYLGNIKHVVVPTPWDKRGPKDFLHLPHWKVVPHQ